MSSCQSDEKGLNFYSKLDRKKLEEKKKEYNHLANLGSHFSADVL